MFRSLRFSLVIALCLSTTWTLCRGQTLRIASYNIEDRPITSTDDQNMRVVLQAIGDLSLLGNAQSIDILAFQEGPANANEYDDIESNMEAVFGGNYNSSFTSPDFAGCRTGFIFNSATIQLVGAATISAGMTHNCRRCQFRPIGGTPADDFVIYSIHLKAGSIDPADAATRATEATILRNNANLLPADSQIIYCGDFNMTGSDEIAYQNLFATGSNATAVDTLNTPFGFLNGARWRDDRAFLPFHTQDPTTSMDDRFDAFFVNDAVIDGANFEYKLGSCSVLGNNASHNLNQNINTGTGAAGFGSQLVAFSDHLPVVCDFTWGQVEPEFNSSINVDATSTHFVRQTGPVGGASASTDLEVEGSSNGSFAAFSVVDFDLTGVLSAGETVVSNEHVVLNMIQDNESFTDGGAIEVYVASATASNISIDSSIQYQSGQNGIACVPTVLSEGAQKVATYAGVHELNGSDLPDGTPDPMGLYGEAIQQAVQNAVNNDGVLRLIVVPAIPQTAATYSGYTSSLGPPRLTADIVADDGSVDVFTDSFSIVHGIQGSGNLVDLNDSDDQSVRFTAVPITAVGESPVQLLFNGSLPVANPQSLEITIESQANTTVLGLEVEAFDFSLGQFESVGNVNSSFVDNISTFATKGNVSRFIGPGNAILTRVSWQQTAPSLLFPWSVSIDLFKWTITE